MAKFRFFFDKNFLVLYTKTAFWACDVQKSDYLIASFFFATIRYKVIVYSATNRTPQKLSTAIASLVIIWSISIALSFPLFFAMNLRIVPMPEKVADIIGDSSIAYCAEEWGEYERGRLVFSCFSFLAQVNMTHCEKTSNLLSF